MIGRVLALAIGLFAGLAASQAPEFAQQYRQRIGGAIDELRRVVGTFDENARAEGLSREQAIARLSGQPDRLTQRQGPAMSEIVDRLERLERQRDAVANAGPFERLVVLARGFDGQLARATYLDYEPAWPATSEGLVIGGAGFLLGWGGFALLFRAFGRLRPGRWRQPPRKRLQSA
ncbi:DUF2937 family protein [Enterovirga aerilata]|uniref:DUF2937 family protein n=1 Tax=Enterovirga aerilata TaxID=2730920 RepID=A0A849HU95_9HYPH|nr:DUF2937 family protein [Enterovirga sp. DB1703]NNM71076.1 DUF2937 family protein [Enterovirga sp. DB1703]